MIGPDILRGTVDCLGAAGHIRTQKTHDVAGFLARDKSTSHLEKIAGCMQALAVLLEGLEHGSDAKNALVDACSDAFWPAIRERLAKKEGECA